MEATNKGSWDLTKIGLRSVNSLCTNSWEKKMPKHGSLKEILERFHVESKKGKILKYKKKMKMGNLER